jgi:hypothetical protein
MPVVRNPYPAVTILPMDREALYGGLISAGHATEYARRMADTLPDTDGSLQMLARHRAAVAEALVRYTEHSLGCAIYQRSYAHGIPDCSCGVEKARADHLGRFLN